MAHQNSDTEEETFGNEVFVTNLCVKLIFFLVVSSMHACLTFHLHESVIFVRFFLSGCVHVQVTPEWHSDRVLHQQQVKLLLNSLLIE
jgi:hypothetical protein